MAPAADNRKELVRAGVFLGTPTSLKVS